MRHELILHPDSRSSAVTRIEVDVTRSAGTLQLRYIVTGKIGELRIPPLTDPARTDELWKHTCFEAFVRAPKSAAYYEFNLSPSTQWAAYHFSGYRSGMIAATELAAPQINVKSAAARYALQAMVEPASSNLPGDMAWRLALSAVIEEASGAKSYWALAHPPGKPDFHHSDCFALELGPA